MIYIIKIYGTLQGIIPMKVPKGLVIITNGVKFWTDLEVLTSKT